jgi:hypothetical protein
MLLNHQIAGAAPFASLDSYTGFGDTTTNRLTAEGNCMRLLHLASGKSVQTAELQFSNAGTWGWNGKTYSSLLGREFLQDNGEKRGILMNRSEQSQIVSLPHASNDIMTLTLSSNQPTQIEVTSLDLERLAGNSNQLTLPPLSITYYSYFEPTGTETADNSEFAFYPYPNPVSDGYIHWKGESLYSDTPLNWWLIDTFGRIVLYGILSKESAQISVKEVSTGAYRLVLQNHNREYTFPVVIQ